MTSQPIDFAHEDEPPRFLRAQALPYPDLKRVWMRAQLTEFADRPDLEMAILGPDGAVEASMTMVDVQHTYISLTMHLREPHPGAAYQLLLRLTRKNFLLDQRAIPFYLVFVDRDEAKAESAELLWTERGVPMGPLPENEVE
jgi:hypothetical protein